MSSQYHIAEISLHSPLSLLNLSLSLGPAEKEDLVRKEILQDLNIRSLSIVEVHSQKNCTTLIIWAAYPVNRDDLAVM